MQDKQKNFNCSSLTITNFAMAMAQTYFNYIVIWRRVLYLTTQILLSSIPIADRVLFSVDYPFEDHVQGFRVVRYSRDCRGRSCENWSHQRDRVVWSRLNEQFCQFVHLRVLEPPSCSGVMCLANTIRVQGEHTMLRTMFAMTVAGLLFAAVSGTSQAAPIAPLPSGVTKDSGGLTQVYYRHRHCFVGRYGHVHCGY